ncbi:MAG: hypothetical protein Q4F25_04890 [Eubacteriales bacterium]|nr:hypothetical protein [Eubacteriales bacterium]
MSILGEVYYDKLTPSYNMEGWMRAERYDFCEDFCESMTDKKGGILSRITAVMMSILA